MNTKLLADTIGSLDGELLDEVIEEHYKRTMPGKTIVIPRYRRAIAVAAILLTVSAAVPLIVINNKPGDIKIPENNGLSSVVSSFFFTVFLLPDILKRLYSYRGQKSKTLSPF